MSEDIQDSTSQAKLVGGYAIWTRYNDKSYLSWHYLRLERPGPPSSDRRREELMAAQPKMRPPHAKFWKQAAATIIALGALGCVIVPHLALLVSLVSAGESEASATKANGRTGSPETGSQQGISPSCLLLNPNQQPKYSYCSPSTQVPSPLKTSIAVYKESHAR